MGGGSRLGKSWFLCQSDQQMWLHLSEEECLSTGDYAKKEEEPLVPDALVDDAPLVPTPAPQPLKAVIPAPPPSDAGPLFRSVDELSDSDSEPDLSKVNSDWANLKLELDSLTLGKKVTKPLKERIAAMEKEYMFDKKQAG